MRATKLPSCGEQIQNTAKAALLHRKAAERQRRERAKRASSARAEIQRTVSRVEGRGRPHRVKITLSVIVLGVRARARVAIFAERKTKNFHKPVKCGIKESTT